MSINHPNISMSHLSTIITSNTLTLTPENSTPQALMWFRRDLRIEDNTALTLLYDFVYHTAQPLENQTKAQQPALTALFVATPTQWLQQDMSLVQLDFMFRTLRILATDLFNKLNVHLQLLVCDTYAESVNLINDYCHTNNITHLAANAEYEVNEIERDIQLAERLNSQGTSFVVYHDQCILAPQTVTTNEGKMYQVFTPFYKRWQQVLDTSPLALSQSESSQLALSQPDSSQLIASKPTEKQSEWAHKETVYSADHQQPLTDILTQIENCHQQALRLFQTHQVETQQVADINKNNIQLQLKSCRDNYPAGESVARERLAQFVSQDIHQYQVSRDQPALIATSQLSAYLAIGALSARQCYHHASRALEEHSLKSHLVQTTASETQTANSSAQAILTWIKELAWRDFYRHVIVDRPDIVKHQAYKQEVDAKIKWSYATDDFETWCAGMTGVPLVDAAMRCLNQTGFMHNRLRMVSAMFLTKDLLIDWRCGERYFMQQLIDGDFASNNGGWQWSASVGTDAAPYFRIMNPFSQAKTHDKQALFIKTWLPELKEIPASILHDEAKLRQALSPQGAYASIDYPAPMVEHKRARLYAIEQFKSTS